MELEPNLFFPSPPFLVKSSMLHLRAAFDLHSDLQLFYRRQPTMPIAQRMVFVYTVQVRDG
jgi:hypothetical protein